MTVGFELLRFFKIKVPFFFAIKIVAFSWDLGVGIWNSLEFCSGLFELRISWAKVLGIGERIDGTREGLQEKVGFKDVTVKGAYLQRFRIYATCLVKISVGFNSFFVYV